MKRGFTLIELVIVILIIGVLAGVVVPLMQIRVDKSKWTEANAAAGMLRRAAQLTFLQDGAAVTGNLGQAAVQAALQIHPGDLTGTFFVPSDYEVISIDDNGTAVIKVTGSRPKAPRGSRTLKADGEWE